MSGQTCGTAPIVCAHLLRRVEEELIDLLRSLASGEWDIQTIAPSWKVGDVAAHLLDTVLRKLSVVRDSCYVEAVEIRSPQDVITLVNRLNQDGVTVYRRLSPPVLIDLMQVACEQSACSPLSQSCCCHPTFPDPALPLSSSEMHGRWESRNCRIDLYQKSPPRPRNWLPRSECCCPPSQGYQGP